MTFKNLGILLFAGTATIACSSTNTKTDESEPQVVTIGLVNETFVKALNFPETITYLGLEKPVDTSVVAFTGNIPNGMVGINGGIVRVGSEEGFDHERPMFWAKVKPFLMDKSPVTVAEFRKFVNATDFKTQAENFGDGGMIGKSTNNTWILKPGANWEYPMGKDFPKAANNHPVTQVSWNDAAAYAHWQISDYPTKLNGNMLPVMPKIHALFILGGTTLKPKKGIMPTCGKVLSRTFISTKMVTRKLRLWGNLGIRRWG